jgi:hypothetical protein
MTLSGMAGRLAVALQGISSVAAISIGDAGDKSAWRINFADGASDGDKAAAQAIVDAFDPAAPALADTVSKLSIVELETFLALRAGNAATASPLSAASQVRLALRWENASQIDRTAADVRGAFTAVFGDARMVELLGP